MFIKFKNKNLLNKNISEKNESKDLFKNQKKILNQIPDQILVIDKLKNRLKELGYNLMEI